MANKKAIKKTVTTPHQVIINELTVIRETLTVLTAVIIMIAAASGIWAIVTFNLHR